MVVVASRRSFLFLHVARFALLALGGLLIGHQAVYVAQYGDGAALAEAMTSGGHDGYWSTFTTVALSGLLLLLLRTAWRLVELRRDAAGIVRDTSDAHPGRAYGRELLRLWPPLFGTVAVAYLIQENIEHLVAQGHLAGFSPHRRHGGSARPAHPGPRHARLRPRRSTHSLAHRRPRGPRPGRTRPGQVVR